MKQLVLISGLLIGGLPSFGQWSQFGYAKKVFGNSVIQATAMNGGDMFWDGTNAGFEVPAGSGRHTIYTGAIWLGGTDSAGTLYLSAQQYRQGAPADIGLFPGPIRNVYSQATHNFHDRIFKVTRAEILAHQAGYHPVDPGRADDAGAGGRDRRRDGGGIREAEVEEDGCGSGI